MNHLLVSLCLGSAFCVTAASAVPLQDAPQQPLATTTVSTKGPVAFIYVSSNPTGGTNDINAYAASASGKLTPVAGSPFREDVASMAVNGKYLFGATRDGLYVDTFSIQSNGGLRWVTAKNVAQSNPSGCGNSGPLVLDHTGSSLYDLEYRSDCSNNSFQSFDVEKSTGFLQELGGSGEDAWLGSPATFLANNVYAYSATCLGNLYWEVAGFKRSSSGLLTSVPIQTRLPAAKTGEFWCPSQTAADRTNHVAISVQAVNSSFTADGAPRLATFTAGSTGNLTTTSSLSNMPHTAVGTVAAITMAPSGKLLAVAGSAGLQIFHFNGSYPIAHYTGLLTGTPISQAYWDNANHLYAISHAANKLYVFTITPTGVAQAAGSPYIIAHPQRISVQPRTALQ